MDQPFALVAALVSRPRVTDVRPGQALSVCWECGQLPAAWAANYVQPKFVGIIERPHEVLRDRCRTRLTQGPL